MCAVAPAVSARLFAHEYDETGGAPGLFLLADEPSGQHRRSFAVFSRMGWSQQATVAY